MSERLLRAVRVSVGASLLALALPAPGKIVLERVPAQGAAPAGQAGDVPLPYTIRDQFGVMWDVQQDGAIGDGGDDLYDGASRLVVNDNSFVGQPSAVLDPAAAELTFAPQTMGGLSVTRRVAVNAQAGWCRFTETLANPAATAVRARIRLNFDLGGGIASAQQVADPRKNTPIGIAIFDGRRAIAMLGGGPRGAVKCRYVAQPNSDQCDLLYDVEVPAKQMVSLVHFQAMRPTSQQATDFMLQAKERDLLAGLPRNIRQSVVNFSKGDPTLATVELPRVELQDIIELRTGDQYRGRLEDATFKLDCFYGKVEVPAERVIGMVSAGRYQPMQQLVTVDGEIIGGTLAGDTLKMELSSGQKVAVPLSAVGRVGCRKRPGESDEMKLDKPVALLNDGQRLIVDLPDEPISVSTPYGDLKVPPAAIAAIGFSGEEQPVHQVLLRDGSKLACLVAGDRLPLRFTGVAAGSASAPAAAIPLTRLHRLQLIAGEAEARSDGPSLLMSNGDHLVGVTDGVLEVQTGFDLLKVNGREIKSIRPVLAAESGRSLPGEVAIVLWGGATVSGRVTAERVDVTLTSGLKLQVPVAAIAQYDQPEPSAPAPMIEQIRKIVAKLSDADWKTREGAAEQLRSIGPAAAVVLRDMREGQSPETQKQIDTILKFIEDQAAARQPQPAGEFNKDEPFPPGAFNKDQLRLVE